MNDKTKKCPFCGQELEKEANFCYYCMKPLNDKVEVKPKFRKNLKLKILLPILSVVLLLIIGSIFFIIYNKKNAVTQNESGSPLNQLLLETETTVEANEALKPTEEITYENNDRPLEPTETTERNNGQTVKPTSPSEIIPPPIKVPTTASPTQNETTTPSAEEETTKPQQNLAPTFLYRSAKRGDDYYTSKDFHNGEIVITGVKTLSKDGTYRIPETIDGKKVVAIMNYAFTAENVHNTVKRIYLPKTVKTVWEYAFINCFNLSDVYFYGTSVHLMFNPFPDEEKRNRPLTIHCSLNCDDRDFHYYKDIAKAQYGANFKEWNG